MDKFGNIYELTNTTKMINTNHHDLQRQREDVARLDGYLRARSEHDRVDHEKVELQRLRDEREQRERRRAR